MLVRLRFCLVERGGGASRPLPRDKDEEELHEKPAVESHLVQGPLSN